MLFPTSPSDYRPAGPRLGLGPKIGARPSRLAALAPFVVVALTVAGVVVVLTRPFADRMPEETEPDAGAGGARAAAVPPRCRALEGVAPFQVGERREPAPDAGDDEEALEPFAPEIGRGARHAGGFAVGVKRDAEGGAVGELALLRSDGSGGRLVRLGRLRGDVDAPIVVVGSGGSVVGMLEPNAGGFALRLGLLRVDGEVAWGAELPQGRDESLAYDLAVASTAVVAVWDDDHEDRSAILLATADPDKLATVHAPRAVSPPEVDAELPRVVVRPGGFWLGYIARPTSETRFDGGSGEDEPAPRYSAQSIEHGWIELVPLGQDGLPSGAARAVTPRGGHALAFDLASSAAGDALVVWRDDDTPVGSDGGRVELATVALGGAGAPALLLDEGVGSGVPSLYGPLLVVPEASGTSRIGLLGSDGTLVGAFRPEPALGRGEVLAADGALLLVARPNGKAMDLGLVTCDLAPDATSPDGGAAPPEHAH